MSVYVRRSLRNRKIKEDLWKGMGTRLWIEESLRLSEPSITASWRLFGRFGTALTEGQEVWRENMGAVRT